MQEVLLQINLQICHDIDLDCGDCMQVQAISYLLSPLLRSSGQEISQPIHLPGPYLENECAAMEPDDVTSHSFIHLPSGLHSETQCTRCDSEKIDLKNGYP